MRSSTSGWPTAASDRDVLEAGCGEGYGADLIADVARRVDRAGLRRVGGRPRAGPLPAGGDAARESRRAAAGRRRRSTSWSTSRSSNICGIRGNSSPSACGCCGPAGVLLMSTPNRITFSPGRDTPINPFHTRELNADELTELLTTRGLLGRVDAGRFSRRTARRARRSARRLDHRRPDRPRAGRRTLARRSARRRRRGDHRRLRPHRRTATATSTTASTWSRSRCGRDTAPSPYPGCSPSSCTRTCRGWPITAAGRSARNGFTSRGRRRTCR